MADLQRMADNGQTVPALRDRPRLPQSLAAAWDCWCDLGGKGSWLVVKSWAEHYGQDFEWLWKTLGEAEHEVSLWRASRSKPPPKPAPKPARRR